jgi:hypothetical protein
MNLTDTQQAEVRAWLERGLKLNEVQKRLETEFGLRLTYLELKLLVSELAVLPKDPEPAPKAAPSPLAAKPQGDARGQPGARGGAAPRKPEAAPPGGLSITVDQLATPGMMVSGSVRFSDGKSAAWYIDQMGRIGVAPKEKGYRPSASDMEEFQLALEQELAGQGY